MAAPEPHTITLTTPGQQVEWKLRMAAAQRGVWTGTELRRLLIERAGLELSALFTKQPSQVKLSTLAALCTALDCVPGDLLTLRDDTMPQPGPSPSPRAAPASAPPSSPAVAPAPTPLNRSLPPL